VAAAAAGDALLLLGFAALGRASHHEGQGSAVVEAAIVALPFLAGWFIVAPLCGLFRANVVRSRPAVARRVPAAWLIGGSLGLLLRSTIQHRTTPPSFDAIALGFNLVTLTAWRLLIASVRA